MKICWFTVNKKKRCSCLNNFQIIQKMCTKKMAVYDTVLEKKHNFIFPKRTIPSYYNFDFTMVWTRLYELKKAWLALMFLNHLSMLNFINF